jgi:SAM-dependent methyltransferase
VKVDYDAELRRYDDVLRRACRVRAGDHVLDLGCGTGPTTRRAARTARAGSALGIDVSAAAVERARELSEGIGNVAFEHADAQVHPFPAERFDLAMSRFGTMFFDDPVVALTNVRRALRPAGRLVMLVWQSRDRNEWSLAIRDSLGGPEGSPAAFSLADPSTVDSILAAAGFTGIELTDVHESVFYGPDVAAALDWVRGFSCTGETLARLDPAAAARVLGRLRDTLAAHAGEDGVWFDSRAWLVTARRA